MIPGKLSRFYEREQVKQKKIRAIGSYSKLSKSWGNDNKKEAENFSLFEYL
ncbi:MAG: hypothetical protein ABI687_08615 [Flavitalea sp.]